jgi:adenylate cyclase
MSVSTQRRLAAIVSADVVGYSRLMGRDEVATLASLRTHRTELIDPLIETHGGRVVKTMGDGLLLEFPSAVNATQCAIEVQRAMLGRNADIADERHIAFRIGINLGEIIFDPDGDIHGDGVNVAARLEALANPGGICLSDKIHAEIHGRIDQTFTDGGEQAMKNIAQPVRVWHWSPYGAMTTRGDQNEAVTEPAKPVQNEIRSVAILPFENKSGDPEQDYFADGIAEDIITDLSKFDWLTVIARDSSFAYRGMAADLRSVARELSARYILQGSVRKSGKRVRITAQLVDAEDGGNIWTERYDREMEDIFDLQDEMTQSICGAIAPELEFLEVRNALGKRPAILTAWDYVVRARSRGRSLDVESLRKARELAEHALELQPGYGEALTVVATVHALIASMGLSDSPKHDAEQAVRFASEALKENPRIIQALCARGMGEAVLGKLDLAVVSLRLAVANNPNYAFSRRNLARMLCYRGDYDEALREAELALTLAPRDMYLSYTEFTLAFCHFAIGDIALALDWATKVVHSYPTFTPCYLILAAAAAELARDDVAKQAVENFLEARPGATVTSVMDQFPATGTSFAERYRAGLTKAGLPV